MTIPIPKHALTADDVKDVRWETVNGTLTLVHNQPRNPGQDGQPFLCAVRGVIDVDGFLYTESGDYDPLNMSSLQQARRSLWLKPSSKYWSQFRRSIRALREAEARVCVDAESFVPEHVDRDTRMFLSVPVEVRESPY